MATFGIVVIIVGDDDALADDGDVGKDLAGAARPLAQKIGEWKWRDG